MKETIYYIKGHPTDDKTANLGSYEETKTSCAKVAISSLGNEHYYIRTYGSYIIDPWHMNNIEIQKWPWKWHKVNLDVFTLYCSFLRTGEQKKLQSVERLI